MNFDWNKVLDFLNDPFGKAAPFYLVLLGTVIFFVLMLALSYYIDGASKKTKRVDPVIKEKNDREKEAKETPKKKSSRKKADKLGSLETPDGRRVSLRNQSKKKL